MEIRRWQPGDLAALHRLNEAATPGVGPVTVGKLEHLLRQSLVSLVAAAGDGAPLGFVVCLSEGADYDSPNYAWVAARYPRFGYVDRVAVDERQRGNGVGAALYRNLVHELTGQRPVLLCEVNEQPPNPGSLRFHKRHGFAEVGRQVFGPEKAVVYLEKRLW